MKLVIPKIEITEMMEKTKFFQEPIALEPKMGKKCHNAVEG